MRAPGDIEHVDLGFLRRAARLALLGHGGAEPNPLVGCVIVAGGAEVRGQKSEVSVGRPNNLTSDLRPLTSGITGWGYHRQCGGAHAEIVALERAGAQARGATMYCTLEPCCHTGRTPPCTEAIIAAGIRRVVIARRDPNPIACGGIERLRAAGIETIIDERCADAIAVSDPFVHRLGTGLPWVTVKWAQTLDGRIATRPPHSQSQWISSEASRRMVHRERGRVDAIMTGIGTVCRDDPLLTPRFGVRLRRPAPPLRVVIDPELAIPESAKLIATAREARTLVACGAAPSHAKADFVARLRARGVEVLALAGEYGDRSELLLDELLHELSVGHGVAHVLVEAGPGLMSRLFRQNLVNEAWVFTAPLLLGDVQAAPALSGFTTEQLTDGIRLNLRSLQRRGGDVIARYRVDRRSPERD